MNKLNAFFFLIIIQFSHGLIAQNENIGLDTQHKKIGDIVNQSVVHSQFIITNNHHKSLFLLRADTDNDVSIHIPKKVVQPGDSTVLYVIIRVNKVGKLKKEIQLYTSVADEPLKLIISGVIKNIGSDKRTDCFSFNSFNNGTDNNKNEYRLLVFPDSIYKINKKTPVDIIDSRQPSFKKVNFDCIK
jgi:hypothetical protein